MGTRCSGFGNEDGEDEENNRDHPYALSEDNFQWSDNCSEGENLESDFADDSSSIASSLSINRNNEQERNTNYTGYEFLDTTKKKKYYFQPPQRASQGNEKHGHKEDKN